MVMNHCCVVSYFETYGSIPELNDVHTKEKFIAMRKVTDITTVHKGDDNIMCVHIWLLMLCSTECARKKLSVELLKFVLFLYIQNASCVSLKSSIVNDQYSLQ